MISFSVAWVPPPSQHSSQPASPGDLQRQQLTQRELCGGPGRQACVGLCIQGYVPRCASLWDYLSRSGVCLCVSYFVSQFPCLDVCLCILTFMFL